MELISRKVAMEVANNYICISGLIGFVTGSMIGLAFGLNSCHEYSIKNINCSTSCIPCVTGSCVRLIGYPVLFSLIGCGVLITGPVSIPLLLTMRHKKIY